MNTWQADPKLQFAHSWWRQIHLAYVPAQTTPLLDEFTKNLLDKFRQFGHKVYDQPGHDTEVLLTTAQFNEPIQEEILPWSNLIQMKIFPLPGWVTQTRSRLVISLLPLEIHWDSAQLLHPE